MTTSITMPAAAPATLFTTMPRAPLHDGGAAGPVRTVEPGVRRARPAPLPRSCHDLMADAGRVLGRAIGADGARDRFAEARLAALRGAAAVLAARARPRRAARASVWDLIPRVAPELAEWAAYFAAASRTRQAINAGVAVPVSAREADDMVRAAAAFLDLVDAALSERRAG